MPPVNGDSGKTGTGTQPGRGTGRKGLVYHVPGLADQYLFIGPGYLTVGLVHRIDVVQGIAYHRTGMRMG